MNVEENHNTELEMIDLEENNLKTIAIKEPHHGQIVERVVRRANIGISEIARKLNISRRTLYNWFESKQISIDIIRKVGYVTGHDFSIEMPDEFAGDYMREAELHLGVPFNTTGEKNEEVYYWMERYIKLLENVNRKLVLGKDITNETVN